MDGLNPTVYNYLDRTYKGNPSIANIIMCLKHIKRINLYDSLLNKGLISPDASYDDLKGQLFISRDTIKRMKSYNPAVMLDEVTVIIILISSGCTYNDAVEIINGYYGTQMLNHGKWGVYNVILKHLCNMDIPNSEKGYLAAYLFFRAGIRKKIIKEILE